MPTLHRHSTSCVTSVFFENVMLTAQDFEAAASIARLHTDTFEPPVTAMLVCIAPPSERPTATQGAVPLVSRRQPDRVNPRTPMYRFETPGGSAPHKLQQPGRSLTHAYPANTPADNRMPWAARAPGPALCSWNRPMGPRLRSAPVQSPLGPATLPSTISGVCVPGRSVVPVSRSPMRSLAAPECAIVSHKPFQWPMCRGVVTLDWSHSPATSAEELNCQIAAQEATAELRGQQRQAANDVWMEQAVMQLTAATVQMLTVQEVP